MKKITLSLIVAVGIAAVSLLTFKGADAFKSGCCEKANCCTESCCENCCK